MSQPKTSNQELISVIVPVYNVEKYVERCIRSLTQQTYRNIEIIVVDDGSPDNAGALCDELSRCDKRIRVIHQKNQGLSGARNTGINEAKGAYLAFVDSDDWVQEDLLETLYKLLIEYNAQIAACGTEIVDDNGHIAYFSDNLEEIKVFSTEEAMNELPLDEKIRNVAWNKLYKKELFNDIRFPVGMIFEDIATTFRLIDKAKTIVYYGKPLYCYYKSESSILRSEFSAKWFDKVTACKMRAEYYQEHHPEISDRVSLYYIRSVLNTLAYSSKKKKAYKLDREKIRQDVICWIENNSDLMLPFTFRVAYRVLKAGLDLYDLIISHIYLFIVAHKQNDKKMG